MTPAYQNALSHFFSLAVTRSVDVVYHKKTADYLAEFVFTFYLIINLILPDVTPTPNLIENSLQTMIIKLNQL